MAARAANEDSRLPRLEGEAGVSPNTTRPLL